MKSGKVFTAVAVALASVAPCAVYGTSTLAVSGSAPNQYYVATTGSDSNNCSTFASACATLAKAASVATIGTYGAVINVAEGTYSPTPANCAGTQIPAVECLYGVGGTSTSAMLTVVCDLTATGVLSPQSKWGCIFQGPTL